VCVEERVHVCMRREILRERVPFYKKKKHATGTYKNKNAETG